jgi:hypothetical protein
MGSKTRDCQIAAQPLPGNNPADPILNQIIKVSGLDTKGNINRDSKKDIHRFDNLFFDNFFQPPSIIIKGRSLQITTPGPSFFIDENRPRSQLRLSKHDID